MDNGEWTMDNEVSSGMKFRYRNEDEMKDSGVEWIGKIPFNWEVLMFKRIIKSVKNGVWGDEPKNNEDDISCIRILNFNRGKMEISIDDLTVRNIPLSKQKEYILEKGDLLIEKSGGGEKSPVGFVARYDHDLPAVYANFMAKISLNKGSASSSFIKYMCSAIYSKRLHLDSINQTTGIQNIDSEAYFKRIITIPRLDEQIKIANFLDEKTTQFDSIILKKEVLIQRLEEAKKSLISEVVTGKVKVVKTSDGYEIVGRKKEEMKDSGVKWLREIPKAWELKAIKYLFQLRNERNTKQMSEVQLLSLFTSLGVIKQGEVEARGNKVRTVEDYKEVFPNDIVVNIILAWMGAIGMSEYRGVISPAYDIYKPINSSINSKFYHYLFRTNRFSGECYKKGRGIMEMRWRTYSNEFKSILVPKPSAEEKDIIVSFLDKRITSIDQLVKRTNKQIQKLKQAKQSLISEAVTGKIEILEE